MKYAVETGSGALIYLPSFIKYGSAIQKLIKDGVHRQHGYLISLLLFFQNKESRLKIKEWRPDLDASFSMQSVSY
jgi:hypothetical protein